MSKDVPEWKATSKEEKALRAKVMRLEAEKRRMYEALTRIANYAKREVLAKNSAKMYGLGYVEALEMAYENMQSEARVGIKGVRHPLPLTAKTEVLP